MTQGIWTTRNPSVLAKIAQFRLRQVFKLRILLAFFEPAAKNAAGCV
jgi:hypothetical protein